MKLKDEEIERSMERVSKEVDASLAALSAALHGLGSDLCVDCENPIEERRKQAMPNARRCIECQGFYEEERLRK